MKPYDRKAWLAPAKRVVVKIGSGVLTRRNGLNLNLIDDLATEICMLRKRGIEVIIVSSGAIAAGLRKQGLNRRPDDLPGMQALAAMGQSHLIAMYEEVFARHGIKAAQILLTRDDLTHRRRYLNARNTVLTLLSWGVIPIFNENDTVVVDEIKFGDNDSLGAMVTNLTEADLLINLTNIDGLYDKDPRHCDDACRLPVVEKIDAAITNMAGAIPGFLGTGGMASKIKAAKRVAMQGAPTVIANGLQPHILRDIFAGRDVGTFFVPPPQSMGSKKHWIAFTKAPKGQIVIDRGAEIALCDNGKSLLPSGMVSIAGRFNKGDAVTLLDEQRHEIGVGMVNYNSGELQTLLGAQTAEIVSRLGYKQADEVIHRDHMVLSRQIQQRKRS